MLADLNIYFISECSRMERLDSTVSKKTSEHRTVDTGAPGARRFLVVIVLKSYTEMSSRTLDIVRTSNNDDMVEG